MAKNKSLMSGIANKINQGKTDDVTEEHPTQSSDSGPLSVNLAGITNPRAPGQSASKIQKASVQRQAWVDPARCRPWEHHNRAYDLLNEERCQDLIASFRSIGKQLRPAIVRTLKEHERTNVNGETHDFEIISGARRHWTVSWLQARNEKNAEDEPYWFLVVVRDDLNTTAAFELSDAENRGQKDISDFERAKEYRWALDSLYESNISKMAEAIHMDRSNLTRLLGLTEMPEAVVKAYPSILDIRASHWRQLSPYFSSKEREKKEATERILSCAKSLAQARENNSPNVPVDGAQTTAMLLASAKEKKRGGDRTQILDTVSAKSTGKMMLKVKRTTRGMTFEVPRASGASKEEISEALQRAIEEYFEA